MPFKSKKQRAFLWAKHPEIARRWTDEYGSGIQNSKKPGNTIGEAYVKSKFKNKK